MITRTRVRALFVASVVTVGVVFSASVAPALTERFSTAPGAQRTASVKADAPTIVHLVYYGGRVISNVKPVEVVYSPGRYLPQVTSTTAPNVASFLGGVVQSKHLDWLSEYDTPTQHVGRGSFGGVYRLHPAVEHEGADIYDKADIQTVLYNNIKNGTLPALDDNTVYMVYTHKGQTVHQAGSNSHRFCAYHNTFVRNGLTVRYAVMPYQGAVLCRRPGEDLFSAMNENTSHELVEAITDPDVGLAVFFGPPLGWYDRLNGEIADICGDYNGTIVGGDGRTYVVQSEWSNRRQACVVS